MERQYSPRGSFEVITSFGVLSLLLLQGGSSCNYCKQKQERQCMNIHREYSSRSGNVNQGVSVHGYQSEKVYLSPRHHQHQQISSPQYYRSNPKINPRIPTPPKNIVNNNSPFVNKIQRKNSLNKSPKRNVMVSPSPKPDLRTSRQRKIVDIEVKLKDSKTSPNRKSISIFEAKPNSGPILQAKYKHQPTFQKIPSFPNPQKLSSNPNPSFNSCTLYCSQQQVINLIHGKISKQLSKMSLQKQLLSSNLTQLKQSIDFYYTSLQAKIRNYRRLDFQKIQDYQKHTIRHIHDYQTIFNKAMGDVINIKADLSKDKTITHEFMINTLQTLLKSYENQKVRKLFNLHKDSSLFTYYNISTLTQTDPPPAETGARGSEPLVKFDTALDVKQIVSSNYIINNPQFSFFDPEASRTRT